MFSFGKTPRTPSYSSLEFPGSCHVFRELATSAQVRFLFSVTAFHTPDASWFSSENGFDGLRTLDLPRSTFQEPGEGCGEEDLSLSPLDLARLTRRGEPREDRLEDPSCLSVIFGVQEDRFYQAVFPIIGTLEGECASSRRCFTLQQARVCSPYRS